MNYTPNIFSPFYTPVFRRDVLWYGDVRPSGSPSVRPSQFSALFSYMLWDIKLKFCVSHYFDARKIKFEYHQIPSIFGRVMSLRLRKIPLIFSFRSLSPTQLTFWIEIWYIDVSWECGWDRIWVRSITFGRVMPLGLRKIPLIFSFRTLSPLQIDILNWNLVYRCVMRIRRLSSNLGPVD